MVGSWISSRELAIVCVPVCVCVLSVAKPVRANKVEEPNEGSKEEEKSIKNLSKRKQKIKKHSKITSAFSLSKSVGQTVRMMICFWKCESEGVSEANESWSVAGKKTLRIPVTVKAMVNTAKKRRTKTGLLSAFVCEGALNHATRVKIKKNRFSTSEPITP